MWKQVVNRAWQFYQSVAKWTRWDRVLRGCDEVHCVIQVRTKLSEAIDDREIQFMIMIRPIMQCNLSLLACFTARGTTKTSSYCPLGPQGLQKQSQKDGTHVPRKIVVMTSAGPQLVRETSAYHSKSSHKTEVWTRAIFVIPLSTQFRSPLRSRPKRGVRDFSKNSVHTEETGISIHLGVSTPRNAGAARRDDRKLILAPRSHATSIDLRLLDRALHLFAQVA